MSSRVFQQAVNVGGSAGHSGTWAIDVSEGVPDENFDGRIWKVRVDSATAAREQAERSRSSAKEAGYRVKITQAMGQFPCGETQSVIGGLAGLSNRIIGKTILGMISDGVAEACEVAKSKRTFPGFRLVKTNEQPDRESSATKTQSGFDFDTAEAR